MNEAVFKVMEEATTAVQEVTDIMKDPEIQPYVGSIRFWVTLIIVVIVIVLMSCSKKLFNLYEKKVISKEKNKKVAIQRNTTAHFITSIIKALLIIVAAIIILNINGVNVTSLVAGLGILSAIVGLALQDVIKDIVTGMRIVSEHYFGIGDVIIYDDIEGEVMRVTIRATAIRDINNNQIVTIANRNFSKAVKLAGEENLNIRLSYDTDVKLAAEVLKKACEEINEVEIIEKCEFRGLQDFEDSSITYRVWYKCLPVNRPKNHRTVNAIIKKHLDNAGLEIPFTQIDVHQK